jgi:hypothetical protein
MNTTAYGLSSLSEAEMSGICGGADNFARDAGQFLGGAASYGASHLNLVTGVNILLPGSGILICLIAGMSAAVNQ